MFLSSFALASLCFVVFSLDANAAATQWTATWNLSNHQSVDWRIEPGASVFRGWTLNINGSMAKGQVYYIRNSPALLGNTQSDGASFSVHEVYANFDGFYCGSKVIAFFTTQTKMLTGCAYM